MASVEDTDTVVPEAGKSVGRDCRYLTAVWGENANCFADVTALAAVGGDRGMY